MKQLRSFSLNDELKLAEKRRQGQPATSIYLWKNTHKQTQTAKITMKKKKKSYQFTLSNFFVVTMFDPSVVTLCLSDN